MLHGSGSERRESRYTDPYEDWASEDAAWGYGLAHVWNLGKMNGQIGPEPGRVTDIDSDMAPLWGMSTSNWPPTGPYTGVGPRNYRRSDARILEDVSDRLMLNGQIDARNISVGVSEGFVELNGSVNTRREKRLAEIVTETVPGVVDVDNRLKIRNNWQM